jgi:chaperone BCS1
MSFAVYPHETFKTFDNLFFEGKQHFIQQLDDFMNNESRYNRLGIPYALGIMLHGIPGAGKTSIIKAISNHCKRSVFVIPTKKIKTIDDLNTVFRSEYISEIDEHIYTKDRLYVFEEFDCGHWENVVKSRDLKKKDTKVVAVPGSMVVEQKEEITLGELLEFLDGMMELRNRMMVFTTNKIEHIDPAILRPGRVDVILELNRLNKQDVQSFYKLWFNENIPSHIFRDMTDYKFTQAEIGALFGGGNERKYIHSVLTK